MTRKNKFRAFTAVVIYNILVTPVVLADTVVPIDVPEGVAKGPTIGQLISRTTNTLAFIAGAASVIAIVIGGIMYISSAGDEKRVQAAKNTILYAVVGVIIALSAFAISSFVITSIK